MLRDRAWVAFEGDANSSLVRSQTEHPAGARIDDLDIDVIAIDAKLPRRPADRLLHRPPGYFDLPHLFFVPLGRCGRRDGKAFEGAGPEAGVGLGRPTTMRYSTRYASVETAQ